MSRSAASFCGYALSFLAKDSSIDEEDREQLGAEYRKALLGHLRDAVDRGFTDAAYLQRKHFDAVREDPEFLELLEAVARQ